MRVSGRVTSAAAAVLAISCCMQAAASVQPDGYAVELLSLSPHPTVSFVDGSSAFQQSFNPAWIEARQGTGGRAGLLVRTQNCTVTVGGSCAHCEGRGPHASSLAFTELLSSVDASAPPQFRPLDASSVVFGPHDASDALGTEDPRIVYEEARGLYHMLYTCNGLKGYRMCLASARDPTRTGSWTLHGDIGLGSRSKSGALLLHGKGSVHYLYWGSGHIQLSVSSDLLQWTLVTNTFINSTAWGASFVEAGPPPLRLSNGDLLFLHNTATPDGAYKPAWVILSGAEPARIVARAAKPLFAPRLPWMRGAAPYTCNVPNVAFVEAAAHTNTPDTFRIWFGGADAVVGTALIGVRLPKDDPGGHERAD